MAVPAPLVFIAQVGMGVKLQHREVGVTFQVRLHGGPRDGMFAAECYDEFLRLEQTSYCLVDRLQCLFMDLPAKEQRGEGGDTHIEFLIIELDVL
jgi:hypothetical protein